MEKKKKNKREESQKETSVEEIPTIIISRRKGVSSLYDYCRISFHTIAAYDIQ